MTRVEPTCTAEGKIVYTKGKRIVEETILKLPHTFNENKICTVCGEEVSLSVSVESTGEYGFDVIEGIYTSNNTYIGDTAAHAIITITGEGNIPSFF